MLDLRGDRTLLAGCGGYADARLKSDLIFDLGFHTGQDTEFYLKKGFRVVAVEANPALVEAGRVRFKRAIADKRLVLINKGVARMSTAMTFFVNNRNAAWSSFVEEIGSRGGDFEKISIETTTLKELLAEFGMPYYLKIDIEGYDDIAVAELQTVKDRPKYVSLENGYPRTLDLLVSMGFDRFKYVDQSAVAEQRLPFPAREGRFALHRFKYESSGAFGEEAPGAWLTRNEVLQDIEAYWATPGLDASIHGWRDLHARVSDDYSARRSEQ